MLTSEKCKISLKMILYHDFINFFVYIHFSGEKCVLLLYIATLYIILGNLQ